MSGFGQRRPIARAADQGDFNAHLKTGRDTPRPGAPQQAQRQPTAQAPSRMPPGDTRKGAIDRPVATSSGPSSGLLGIGQASTAEHVHDALTGRTVIDRRQPQLTPADQRHLIDKALDGWGPEGADNARELVRRVEGDPALKAMVGERLAARAARLMERPKGDGTTRDGTTRDPHIQAKSTAIVAIDALGGDRAAMAKALKGLSREEGARFAQSLNQQGGGDLGIVREAHRKVLQALNDAPPSATTSAIVQNVYAQVSPAELASSPQLRRELASAIAREWHPEPGSASAQVRNADAARLETLMGTREGQALLTGGTEERNVTALAAVRADPSISAETLRDVPGDIAAHPAVARAMAGVIVPQDTRDREAEVGRLTGILQTPQGRELLFGNPAREATPTEAPTTTREAVPAKTRAMAREVLLSDRSITADTLRNPPRPSAGSEGSHSIDRDNPWHNPAIVARVARAEAGSFKSDKPITVNGRNLENLIGAAMGARAKLPDGVTEQQAWSRAARGDLSFYAAGPDAQAIAPVAASIREIAGNRDDVRVTVLPITYSSPSTGAVRLPLFRVETPQGERYVDNRGTVYDTFDDWRTGSQLPPGLMVYPQDGRLGKAEGGAVALSSAYTPRTPDTLGEKVEKIAEDAALAGGRVAAGALIVGTAGTVGLALAGIGAGWSARREASVRSQLGLPGDPPTDSAARGLPPGLAATDMGLRAFASEAALERLAREPGTLSGSTAPTIGTITPGASGNESIDLFAKWDRLTPDQRADAVLQLGLRAATTGVAAEQGRSFAELLNPMAAAGTVMDGYQPMVVRDSLLDGNRVALRLDPATGLPVIHAGDHAAAQDIQLHTDIARAMARDIGLTGFTRQAVLSTPGHALTYENMKRAEELQALRSELAGGHLPPERRRRIELEIEARVAPSQHQLLETAGHGAADPDAAQIAEPTDGWVRPEEIQAGLGNVLPPGYFWRTRGTDRLPEIVRSERAAAANRPRLRLLESPTEPRRYEIAEVTNDAKEPILTHNDMQGMGLRSGLAAGPGLQAQEVDEAVAARRRFARERDKAAGGRRHDRLRDDERADHDARIGRVIE